MWLIVGVHPEMDPSLHTFSLQIQVTALAFRMQTYSSIRSCCLRLYFPPSRLTHSPITFTGRSTKYSYPLAVMRNMSMATSVHWIALFQLFMRKATAVL